MEDSLGLFRFISNDKRFDQSTMILCFTKMDVFKKKIATGASPIGKYFPDYEGAPADVAATQAYITGKFRDLYVKRSPLRVCHLDATNTDDVRNVLAHIFDGQVPPSQNPSAHHKRNGSASNMYVSFISTRFNNDIILTAVLEVWNR